MTSPYGVPTRAHRPLIMGRHGAVGANHPLAAQAGLQALRRGGNAADAAVAVGLTLGVVEPHMSGLGGDGFYHLHLAAGDVARVFNGCGPAPRAATSEAFASGMDVHGPRSVSVPGGLAALAAMHRAHGRLPWADLFGDAITLARDGFAATHAYRHYARENIARLVGSVFLCGGAAPPPLGTLIRQPDLADTLEAIATEGAETFYRGSVALRLAAAMRTAGGLVGADDLAAIETEITAPIGIHYRGFEVRQTPPNSTGFTMLQMLRIAERFDLADMAPEAVVHIMVEAKKRAFVDRERYGADPRFAEVPLDMLLSDARADEAAASIDPDRAADLPLVRPQERVGDTTYFCVVDAEGNAVSGIQSINSAFGSGVVAGETGVLLNNRMAYWHLDPDHANRLMPGKRVRHTMNAPMVFRDGRLWGVLGTPGADNQVQMNVQALVAMIDFGADPQAALEAPKWTDSQVGQGANWPHDGDGRLSIEPGFDAAVYAGLERRGHRLNRVGPLEAPVSQQAIRVLDNGVRMAGSDPRRDGWACAY